MKSSKFWAGLALVMVLSCVSFAFGETTNHSQSLYVGSTSSMPASLLTVAFAPGANFQHAKPANGGWGGGGGNGGGGGCGQGGNGGGWGNGGNGWGGGGNGGGNGGNGGCGVPEGGNSMGYLALAGLACLGAMVYRRQSAVAGSR